MLLELRLSDFRRQSFVSETRIRDNSVEHGQEITEGFDFVADGLDVVACIFKIPQASANICVEVAEFYCNGEDGGDFADDGCHFDELQPLSCAGVFRVSNCHILNLVMMRRFYQSIL